MSNPSESGVVEKRAQLLGIGLHIIKNEPSWRPKTGLHIPLHWERDVVTFDNASVVHHLGIIATFSVSQQSPEGVRLTGMLMQASVNQSSVARIEVLDFPNESQAELFDDYVLDGFLAYKNLTDTGGSVSAGPDGALPFAAHVARAIVIEQQITAAPVRPDRLG